MQRAAPRWRSQRGEDERMNRVFHIMKVHPGKLEAENMNEYELQAPPPPLCFSSAPTHERR